MGFYLFKAHFFCVGSPASGHEDIVQAIELHLATLLGVQGEPEGAILVLLYAGWGALRVQVQPMLLVLLCHEAPDLLIKAAQRRGLHR